MKKMFFLIPLMALMIQACSDDDSNETNPINPTPGTSSVRVAHVSPDAPNVDVWVDGTRVLQNVPFRTVSNYLNVASGVRRVQISPAGQTTPMVLDTTVTLASNQHYTVAATGRAASLRALMLTDDRAINSAQARVRFIHASPDAPAVDVAVANGSVLFGNVAFRGSSSYATVAPNQYVLDVRLAGSNTVALRVPAVQLGAGAVYTIFAVGLAGDGTLSALPLIDSGTPATLAQSQLRVAHLSPDAPSVDVWVDGVRGLSNVPFRAVSDYLTVPSGQHWVQVTPAGADQPVVIDEVITAGANGAYTVAATGRLADLTARVYTDNRSMLSDAPRVRFIHASPDAPAVDIVVSGGPMLFSNVAFGANSTYQDVPSSTYALDVKISGSEVVALRTPHVPLGANVNYTIFAVGLAANSTLEALVVVDAGTPRLASLRLAHLSPDAPNVDIWLDGHYLLRGVPYSAVSGYLPIPSGSHRIQVTPADEPQPVVIDATAELSESQAYTVAATGLLSDNDLRPVIMADDLITNAPQAKVRFVHTSPNAPAVDVAVAGGPVLFPNVPFRTAANYLSVASGNYDLEVRIAGTSDIALAVPGVVLTGGTNYTVFAIGLANGQPALAALPTVDAP